MEINMENEMIEEVDDILRKLLDNRDFQEIWIKRVEDAKTQIEKQNMNPIRNNDEAEASTSDRLVVALKDLTSAIQFSIETFLKSADLAFGHCLPAVNRDASDTYPIKFQVERLTATPQLDIEKFCLVARRLLQLLKNLNRRLSTPPQLANLTQFSATICDVMYQLERWLAKCVDNCPYRKAALLDFQRAIDEFNCMVVGELERHFLDLKLFEQERKRSKSAQSSPMNRCKAFTKKYQPPWDGEKENKWREGGSSWIPSKELQKMRQLLKPRQFYSEPKPSQKRLPMRPIGSQTQGFQSNQKRTRNLEEKWDPIFNAKHILQESLATSRDGKTNFKLVQEITEEVMRKLKLCN